MKRSKICIISHASDLYGAPRALALILSKLDLTKFEPIVIFPSKGPLVDYIEKLNIPVYIITRVPVANFLQKLRYSLQMVSLLLQQKPDYLYVNTIAQVEPFIVAKLLKVKSLVHVRESDTWFTGRSFSRKLRNHVILNFPDKYICVSKATARLLLDRKVSSDKVTVVFDGIDHEKFRFNQEHRTEKRVELGIDDDAILIGFIGQISDRKGVDTFLNAAKIVLEKNNKYKFVLIGGPLNSSYFNDIILPLIPEGFLGKSIIFTDFKDDTYKYYSALDIFVNSSRKEPFAMVNLESMSMSLPVIATDAGGNSESIIDGETGFIVPVNLPEAIAQKIVALGNNDSLRKNFGKKARFRVESNFTLQHYYSNVEKVIVGFF